MISIIIPSHNNLKHLKNVYTSIIKHAPGVELILLDDGSTDGTWEWMQTVETLPNNKTRIFRSKDRVGHTILYDTGIDMATNDIVGILHADMIIGPKYVENMLKHLEPGKVICATRIEPPLHPEGKEKIIQDFGMDFDTLDIDAFETYTIEMQQQFKNQTTKGMFAPWILYKSDFQSIGGHDPLFAPFPYEDSDIFQRWILAGYELIQSRDAFVYHLTCRGHRWNEQVGKDDDYFKVASAKASRNYLRKWGTWIQNDEYQYPIIKPKYDIAIVLNNSTGPLVKFLEPWCNRIFIDIDPSAYILEEQGNTQYDLTTRVHTIGSGDPKDYHDIVVEMDGKTITDYDFNIIQHLAAIIKDSGGEPYLGEFEISNLKIYIQHLTEYQKDLIVCSTSC